MRCARRRSLGHVRPASAPGESSIKQAEAVCVRRSHCVWAVRAHRPPVNCCRIVRNSRTIPSIDITADHCENGDAIPNPVPAFYSLACRRTPAVLTFLVVAAALVAASPVAETLVAADGATTMAAVKTAGSFVVKDIKRKEVELGALSGGARLRCGTRVAQAHRFRRISGSPPKRCAASVIGGKVALIVNGEPARPRASRGPHASRTGGAGRDPTTAQPRARVVCSRVQVRPHAPVQGARGAVPEVQGPRIRRCRCVARPRHAAAPLRCGAHCGAPRASRLRSIDLRSRGHRFCPGPPNPPAGFPCNQFAGQEPGTEEQIESDVCSVFKASFPIMAKVDVNGDGADPLWKWMKKEKPGMLGRETIVRAGGARRAARNSPHLRCQRIPRFISHHMRPRPPAPP